MDEGNYLLALDHYQQAAYSDELEDVIPWDMIALVNQIPGYETHTHEYQTAIAFFRMIAIHLLLGDQLEADEILIEMEQIYPEGSAGSEFIEFAQRLIEEIGKGNSLEDSCKSVTKYILSNYPNLEYDIGDWGLTNISFRNETICPFISE